MNEYKVILIGAKWCGPCKAMKEWYWSLEIPGITFTYWDMEDADERGHEECRGITSVPVILFKVNGMTIARIEGAISKEEMINKINHHFNLED